MTEGDSKIYCIVFDYELTSDITVFFILLHWPAYFIKLYRFGDLYFAGY